MSKVRQLEIPGFPGSSARRVWLKSVSAMAAVSAMGTLAGAPPARAAAASKSAAPMKAAQDGKALMAFVGTYTPHGLGIHRFRVDRATGKLDALEPVQGIENPSALAIDAQQRFLFSVSEVKNYNGTTNGSVSSYAIEPGTGALRQLSTVNSQGAGPVYLSLHPNGRFLLVANYVSGSVAVLPVGGDGTLGEAVSVQAPQAPAGAQHAAEGVPGSFAISDHDGPHAHTIVPSPDGRFAISTDLGVDRTYMWKFDETSGALAPNDPPFVAASAGAGPRHVAFHPNGRYLYEVTEEASTLVTYGYDAARGTLAQLQSVSTLPAGYEGTSFASEIMLSHDARFIYVANRLHDTIAQFGIGADGRVHWIGEIHTGGDYPRVIRFDPTGRFLYALNQRSDHIAIFAADKASGKLRFTGTYVAVGSPSDIAFAAV
ncbi:lactonase family protein [Paraburkholderia ferrariae]|uniref:lactonase family protein n=1 Tax=Paraburkholderia ferrariae TaxID=386056 RepID=UPI0006950E94|nr:lactonase family protein [Paraburkholderia ferrariae]